MQNEEINCSICFEEIKEIAEIECDHKFCFSCIKKWSVINNNCPICRKVFNQITKKGKDKRNSTRFFIGHNDNFGFVVPNIYGGQIDLIDSFNQSTIKIDLTNPHLIIDLSLSNDEDIENAQYNNININNNNNRNNNRNNRNNNFINDDIIEIKEISSRKRLQTTLENQKKKKKK